MASTTIHTLSYKMSVDSRAFTEGMTATRKELRAAGRIMKETRTPTQKLEEDLIELNRLYKLGAIDAQGYTRRLDQLEEQFKKTENAADDSSDSLRSQTKTIAKWALGLGAAKLTADALIGSMKSLAMMVGDQFETLDALAKKSDEIGIDPRQLMRLERITELTSTFTADQLDTALRKMTVRISQAAAGTGEAVATLEELNLNAAYLNMLAPDEQFLAIADALGSVEQEGDQARLVMKLFDDEAIALVNTLRLGSEEILTQTEHINGYTREQLAGIEKANDSWTIFHNTVGDTLGMLAVEFAPAVQDIAEQLTELAKSDAFAEMLRSAMSVAEQLLPMINGTINTIQAILKKSEELGVIAYHVADGGWMLSHKTNGISRAAGRAASEFGSNRGLRPVAGGGGGFNASMQREQLDATRETNALLRQRNEQPPAVVGGL